MRILKLPDVGIHEMEMVDGVRNGYGANSTNMEQDIYSHSTMSFKVEGANLRRQSWTIVVTLIPIFILLTSGSCSADDGVPPQVDRVFPPNGANLSPGDQMIELNFTEAMNRTSVENSVLITPFTDFSPRFWTVDNTTVFFMIFAHDETYHFTLQDTAKDVNETQMESPYYWSYTVTLEADTAGGEEFRFPWWVGVLPGTLPFVLILVAWLIYERNKEKSLTPEQRAKLRELQPKRIDNYDILVLGLFTIILVLVGLYFAFGWFEVFFIIGILAPIVGFMALFGFFYGMSDQSRRRRMAMEEDEFGFPLADMRVIEKRDKTKFIKELIIGFIILAAVFSIIPGIMMTSPGEGINVLTLLSGFLYFIPIFVILTVSYYYFSKSGGSGNGR